jgi:pimeloyl-ACP methyl ester carboxylesterase
MATVELTAGPLDYEDSGGDGPVLVFLGGVLMDGSVWDPVVAGAVVFSRPAACWRLHLP